jgi:hypothetical protein
MLFMITVIFIGILKRINSQTTTTVSGSSSSSVMPIFSNSPIYSNSAQTTYTYNGVVVSNSPLPRSASPLQIQVQPSPVVSVFSLVTVQEWIYTGVVIGFVILCIFISMLNQHIRINKLEKKLNNLRYAQQIATIQSPMKNMLSSQV